MSRLSKVIREQKEANLLQKDKVIKNFMNGDSYGYNPLTTLKMITASSIFGEPSYYRNGGLNGKAPKKAPKYTIWNGLKEYTVVPVDYVGKTTTQIMTEAIDAALSYNYIGTLNWAITLRTFYNIRLNPQIIMVRAALHPNRKMYTENNTVDFRGINNKVMLRADEPLVQMAYYLFLNNGRKNNIPSILKRSWADKISSLKPYAINKYKNAEIGMINGVRICHAHSKCIDELMNNGHINIEETDRTWEQLRQAGYSWLQILDTIELGHMALLRNLRNIFNEINNVEIADAVIEQLKNGVLKGRQFPFRYYTAYQQIKMSNIHHKDILLDALEDCIDISIENMPKIKGKTICLTDNSGSAWGTLNTEYGSVKVAEIDNLSSIITAKCSDKGYVGVFGDRLTIVPISKHDKVLRKMEEINRIGHGIGGSTEGGVWIFFRDALKDKTKYNNIFIYSDMQAGHSGLYGTGVDIAEYSSRGFADGRHVNVFKVLLHYRKTVNKDVNFFSVQTAGYDNALVPEYAERTALLYGWTGKESIFADILINIWDNKI